MRKVQRYNEQIGAPCSSACSLWMTRFHLDTQKRQRKSFFLLLFVLICSVLEFHGPNNGTTLHYTFSLWVQLTNTNVKITPLQKGLKYSHTQSLYSLSLSLSLSNTHTHTHLLLTLSVSDYLPHTTCSHSFTTEYILKKTKQVNYNF